MTNVAEIASKSDVMSWESVASFVSTFPSDDGEGACDVDVQIGETDGVWFIRTTDDAGGSDDADDTAYESRDEAEAAAEALADDHDEGDGESAEDYRRAADEAAAGEPDADGQWCVYWETALDDAGPRERYTTQEQAEAAAKIANAGLHAHNPGGNLLCGFSVRASVDGVWTESEA
jgi:hypothetical protein